MKKIYYNPEIQVVKFKSCDNTNLNPRSMGGTTETVTNKLKSVSLGVLNK